MRGISASTICMNKKGDTEPVAYLFMRGWGGMLKGGMVWNLEKLRNLRVPFPVPIVAFPTYNLKVGAVEDEFLLSKFVFCFSTELEFSLEG